MNETRISILSIGSEVVTGKTLDTNSNFIADVLRSAGFAVERVMAVHDDEPAIVDALDFAFRDSAVVVTTGGLGPTFDDITLPVIARYFGLPMRFDRRAYASILRYFKSRRGILKRIQPRQQSFMPKGARIIPNTCGVVPGVICDQGNRITISVPGVPHEMKAMIDGGALAWLKKRFAVPFKQRLVICTAGVGESTLEKKIVKFVTRKNTNGASYGIYPQLGEVQIRVDVTAATKRETCRQIAFHKKTFTKLIGDYIFSFENETLEARLLKVLLAKKRTVALAESCTGGLIASTLTNVPGMSAVFKGSVVAYANEAKESFLEVPAMMLAKYGAVSGPVAHTMAAHARKFFNTDYAIAVTGIAGPGGGTKEKPVGLVFIAIAHPRGVNVHRFVFSGNRMLVRMKTLKTALWHLWQVIEGKNAPSLW